MRHVVWCLVTASLLAAPPRVAAQGNFTPCIVPWAVPDRWIEAQMAEWDRTDTFDRYYTTGSNVGQLLPNPDTYVRAVPGGDPGTGFRIPADYGTPLTLKVGDKAQSPAKKWFLAVDLSAFGGSGGRAGYREAIANCFTSASLNPGVTVPMLEGSLKGETAQGVADLITTDPAAYWDAMQGGVVASGYPPGASPRIVWVMFYDPDVFQATLAANQPQIQVVKILPVFVDGIVGKDVVGYLLSIGGVVP